MGGNYLPPVIPETDLAMFRKGRFGGLVGCGRHPAVLVVDMTRGFVEDAFPNGCESTGRPAAEAILLLVDEARALGLPIFYTTGAPRGGAVQGRWEGKKTTLAGETDPMNTPEAHQIVSELAPQPGEMVLVKSKPSAFFGTQLASLLIYLGVDSLVVTGMTTSGCVRATVVDAFSYNFRVMVPMECVADRGQVSHQVSLFDMDQKYADVLPLREVLRALRENAVSGQVP